MNCANAPCETCQWRDTCERYIEEQELEEILDRVAAKEVEEEFEGL